MAIDRREVEYVAHLSRLWLTEQEKEKFAHQLTAIIGYMDKLNELDTSGVEPMVHAIEQPERLRRDMAGESLSREEALRNAPQSRDGYFVVPRIID